MAVKEKKTIDPRTQAGAYVKTPGGLRAYVVKRDPKDSDRVIIEYAAKGMGTDNYQKLQTKAYAKSLLPLEQLTEDVRFAKNPAAEESSAAIRIIQLWTEAENAEEVAKRAMRSALESARLCGELLLEEKAKIKHGGWEKFRETLIHPTTGKSMPSSTATLYQRIAERWSEIEQSEVRTLRGAARSLRAARKLLKSDRQIKAPQPVADLPEKSAALKTTPNTTATVCKEPESSLFCHYDEREEDKSAQAVIRSGLGKMRN